MAIVGIMQAADPSPTKPSTRVLLKCSMMLSSKRRNTHKAKGSLCNEQTKRRSAHTQEPLAFMQ